MIKDIDDGLTNRLRLIVAEMEILKEHFPACFHSDGSFDLVRFQEFLSDKVPLQMTGTRFASLARITPVACFC